MEIWKKIEGYENYEVSNLGRVKRCDCIIQYNTGKNHFYKEKILKPDIVKGYERVTLSKNNNTKRFLVHRLVSKYFILNPDNKICVNHKNGIKTDNRIDNLEWNTYSENEKHSHRVLGKITNGIKSRKIDIKYLDYIKNSYNSGITQKQLSEEFGVCAFVIHSIVNNKRYVKHI